MNFDIKNLSVVVFFILFGASAHLSTRGNKEEEELIKRSNLYRLRTLVICCFTGSMFGLFVMWLGYPIYAIIVSSAIGSYMGEKGAKRIVDTFTSIINKKTGTID